MEWNQILQWLNTGALVAFAYLMAKGYLVPMPVVERHMLAPLTDRIAALERISAKKEEQNIELQKLQASAIEALSRALEMIQRGTHS